MWSSQRKIAAHCRISHNAEYVTMQKVRTVTLSLYVGDATVVDVDAVPSGDNNIKRSLTSKFTFTNAERPKRTCGEYKINLEDKLFNLLLLEKLQMQKGQNKHPENTKTD